MPYIYRTLCEVLEDMRKCGATRNYSYLEGLIEEAQSMGNRMEAKLDARKDLNKYREEIRELEKEIKKLKKAKEKLEGAKK